METLKEGPKISRVSLNYETDGKKLTVVYGSFSYEGMRIKVKGCSICNNTDVFVLATGVKKALAHAIHGWNPRIRVQVWEKVLPAIRKLESRPEPVPIVLDIQ